MLKNKMFSYQCRYCKVSFEQWGKLVSHKRDEHRDEFEALRRALLQRTHESAKRKFLQLESNLDGSETHSPIKSPRIAITMSETKTNGDPQRSTKELDARDLENQEISMSIPLNCSLQKGASTSTSSLPSHLQSPMSVSYQNGITSHHIHHYPSFSQRNHEGIASSSHPSSLLIIPPPGDLLLNGNWTPPTHSKSVVLYHQINDEDEIEFCVCPSAGSQISVTKHSVPSPYYFDAIQSHPHLYSRLENSPLIHLQRVADLGRIEPLVGGGGVSSNCNSQIVVDPLEDELQMTCSKGPGPSEERPNKTTNSQSQLELLRSRGKRLQQLYSQFQHRNKGLHGSSLMTLSSGRNGDIICPSTGGGDNKRLRLSNEASDNDVDYSGTRYPTRASPRRANNK